MSGRYEREVRWRFSSLAAMRYVQAGRKLLAELANRARLGGLGHVHRRVVLNDGTVIEATFVGPDPIVRITTAGRDGQPGEACSIYLESGLLDLGAPSNYTTPPYPWEHPTFAGEADATLQVGTDACAGEFDKPHGSIRVATFARPDGGKHIGVQGSCWDQGGRAARALEPEEAADGLPFGVTQAEKRACQARLPASCFSGLTQLWVQALYGSPAAVYRRDPGTGLLAVPTTETPEGEDPTYLLVNHQCWDSAGAGGTVGLIDLSGDHDYWFVGITMTAVEVRRAVSITGCGQALLAFLKASPDLAREDRQKVEAVYLSTVRPSAEVAQTLTHGLSLTLGEGVIDSGWRTTTDRAATNFGWRFSPTAPKAVLAYKRSGNMDLDVLTFAASAVEGEVLTASLDRTTSTAYFSSWNSAPMQIGWAYDDAGAPKLEHVGASPLFLTSAIYPSSLDVDFPLLAWYGPDGALWLVRYRFVVLSLGETQSNDGCRDLLTIASDNVGPLCHDDGTDGQYAIASLGFYVTKDGVSQYSEVATADGTVRSSEFVFTRSRGGQAHTLAATSDHATAADTGVIRASTGAGPAEEDFCFALAEPSISTTSVIDPCTTIGVMEEVAVETCCVLTGEQAVVRSSHPAGVQNIGFYESWDATHVLTAKNHQLIWLPQGCATGCYISTVRGWFATAAVDKVEREFREGLDGEFTVTFEININSTGYVECATVDRLAAEPLTAGFGSLLGTTISQESRDYEHCKSNVLARMAAITSAGAILVEEPAGGLTPFEVGGTRTLIANGGTASVSIACSAVNPSYVPGTLGTPTQGFSADTLSTANGGPIDLFDESGIAGVATGDEQGLFHPWATIFPLNIRHSYGLMWLSRPFAESHVRLLPSFSGDVVHRNRLLDQRHFAGMAGETVTGGYAAVDFPSWVGWA